MKDFIFHSQSLYCVFLGTNLLYAEKCAGMRKNMRVCMICEGSYPYVAGGVSSWIQMLISENKDLEFSIWSIATSETDMSEHNKYKVPENVKEIKTVYINDIQFTKGRKIRLKQRDKETLEALLTKVNSDLKWEDILSFMKEHRERLTDIILGKDFYDIALKLYQSEYSRIAFNNFLWNMRSMYFPLMYILTHDIPQADIYHSVSTGYAGVLGGAASHIYDKPFMITEHGIYTREREEEIIKSDWVMGPLKEIWIEFFIKLSLIAYYSANRVFTLFETNKTLQVELGCPYEKITIVPNGIDYERFSKLPRRSNQEQEEISIGVVARVVPIKDIKTTLLAYDIAKKQVPNMKLYILGPFDENKEYYGECLSMVKDMQIQAVIFTGNVSLDEYLPQLDMMLLTSISEGQPLAVLEGMAAGIPQICTNVGSCKELLKGSEEDSLGDAGFIVPIMNINSIAKAIETLAKDQDLRKKMGDIGCIRIEKHYQKLIFLKRYRDTYLMQGGRQDGRSRIRVKKNI